MPEDSAGRLVATLAGCHDLGKASPPFQSQLEDPVPSLKSAGFAFQHPPVKTLHGFVTAVSLRDILVSREVDSEVAEAFAYAVAGHHGSFPAPGDLEISKGLGTSEWHDMRRALFNRLVTEVNAAGALGQTVRLTSVPPWIVVQLAGLSSVSDWIASSEDIYEHHGRVSSISDYASRGQVQAKSGLRRLMWLQPEHPRTVRDFSELFPFKPRPAQQAVQNIAGRLAPPALVIVEAPTGEGKTEAALYLADRLASCQGQTGFYYALPTQATSNQMFGRLVRFLPTAYKGEFLNLQLLHGHAALSTEVEQLRRDAQVFLEPTGLGEKGEGDGFDGAPAAVVTSEWFTQRKRGLLAPFGVGTVDQALLAVLQTRHFFVRLWGLAGKVVVIDEVHAYDVYMLGLIEELLAWLSSLGSSVVLLSATLPLERRRALIEAYHRGLGSGNALSVPEVAYPRLTWCSPVDSGAVAVRPDAERARKVSLRFVHWEPEDGPIEEAPPWAFELQSLLQHGGCAAVICNTVGQAQTIYRTLKPVFPGADAGDGLPEIDLFHAHYLYGDRSERERRTLGRFGKVTDPSVKRPARAVLVATQVVEQSLDLDFDLMVSELAPVDLVIQRMGRLWRHTETARSASLAAPELWLLEPPEDESGVPRFPAGWTWVYDEYVLLRSWLAVRTSSEIVVPDQVERLVEEVYGTKWPTEDLEAALQRRIERTRLASHADAYELSKLSRQNAVRLPITTEVLFLPLKAVEEDNPDVHVSLQALTRIGGPSVRVVALYGREDEAYLDRALTERVDLSVKPDNHAARRLLERSITVTHRGAVPGLVSEGVRPAQWRLSPHVRHHRVIFLDESGSACVGEWRLCLDPELGLVVRPLNP